MGFENLFFSVLIGLFVSKAPTEKPGSIDFGSSSTERYGVLDNSTPDIIPAHDFHASVMRIDHNPETKSLEVTLKIFTDDIEQSLEGLGAPKLRLGTPEEFSEADSIFVDYLNNRIAFFVDEQQKAFEYLGKEVELDNTTWCYLEVKDVETFKTLRIKNKVLTELFEDQSNLVNINAFGTRKSLLLRGGQPEDTATF